MVNKHSSVAMYQQIAQELKDDILQKRVMPGECLGSHTDLAKRFDVSLITIRKAVTLLVEEGAVVVRQGKGTFVSLAHVEDGLNKLTGFSTVLKKHQMQPEVLVKELKTIETPELFPQAVRSALGEECLYIERTHMVDKNVIGYARLYLPYKYGKSFSIEDISNHTIYELYVNKLGMELGKGVQSIYADKASKSIAAALGISENTPVLKIERESYSKDGELIEYMKSYYEYTQYAFRIELALSLE